MIFCQTNRKLVRTVKIERLNKDKVKVTLTNTDLINLDIDVERLSPNSNELHTFLFHIMETIQEETGFNPYIGQVVVEATPSRDGVSIIVSRMKTSKTRITREQFHKATAVKVKKKKAPKPEIFYFELFEDLCAALKEFEHDFLVSGSLYKLNGIYCFVIRHEAQHAKSLNTILEFSSKKSAYPLQLEYIKEHGKLVAKSRELVKMAEKIKQLV